MQEWGKHFIKVAIIQKILNNSNITNELGSRIDRLKNKQALPVIQNTEIIGLNLRKTLKKKS